MYKYRRYHPIFGNNQHGWFFTHMCGFYPTSEYPVDIWKKPHVWFLPNTSKSLYCLEKKHTCVAFTMVPWYFTMVPWYFMYFWILEIWKICSIECSDKSLNAGLKWNFLSPMAIYVVISTHVWFLPHVCGKIHTQHSHHQCGFYHRGVCFCTHVWK